jgi:hypothetical protein
VRGFPHSQQVASGPGSQLIDAAAVALMLGVTRGWVYEHATELGAVRLGSGTRPRLRFDPLRVGLALEEGLASGPRRRRPQRFRRSVSTSEVELLPITGVPSKRASRQALEGLMPRPAKGQVIETKTKSGVVYALRFTAYGERQYVTLGSRADGWTRQKAEGELQNVLTDVRRGTWRTPAPGPTHGDPTFHEFASEWLAARKPAIAPSTYQAYRNELVHHLLPFFHRHRLSQITVAEVDRYRDSKLRAGRMAPSYINATITRLGTILDVADERELITRNPVRVNPRQPQAQGPARTPRLP